MNNSLKKIFNVFFVLLKGNVVASLLGILVVSLVTKNISLELYGVIVMLQAYVMLIDQLFNFQSWQALIKYCSISIEKNNKEMLLNYFQLGLILDFFGSIVGFIVSLALFPLFLLFLPEGLGLSYSYVLYSSLILFRMIGLPTALLRLSDDYKRFNYQLLINWGGKCFFISLAVIYDHLNIKNILLIFLFFEVVSSCYLIFYGFKSLGVFSLKVSDLFSLNNIYSKYKLESKRFLIFSLKVNLNSALLGSVRNIDELLVGGLVGSGSAGVFKIMKLMAGIFSKLLDPLYISIYPELSKLVAKGDVRQVYGTLKVISLITLLVSIFIYLVFYTYGITIIGVLFTESYALDMEAIKLYLLGVLVPFIFIYIQPVMLSLGLEGHALAINFFSSLIYIGIIIIFTKQHGLLSVAFAFLVFSIISIFPKLYYSHKKISLIEKENYAR